MALAKMQYRLRFHFGLFPVVVVHKAQSDERKPTDRGIVDVRGFVGILHAAGYHKGQEVEFRTEGFGIEGQSETENVEIQNMTHYYMVKYSSVTPHYCINFVGACRTGDYHKADYFAGFYCEQVCPAPGRYMK
jgi:hypothetical protein